MTVSMVCLPSWTARPTVMAIAVHRVREAIGADRLVRTTGDRMLRRPACDVPKAGLTVRREKVIGVQRPWDDGLTARRATIDVAAEAWRTASTSLNGA